MFSYEFLLWWSSEGDVAFTSQRRFWQQTAAKAGVKTWGYLFTQPQPEDPPSLGGKLTFARAMGPLLSA